MTSVLHISKSKRSCSWRDINFVRALVNAITDCPNTQLALWTNSSGDGMRQLIRNTAHSIVNTMGLPIHRIAFAWTGDRSTPAGELRPQPPPGTDPHLLIKDPRTIYNALRPDIPYTSAFLLASCDNVTSPDPWPNGHSLLFGPNGVSDLTNGPQFLDYLRRLSSRRVSIKNPHLCIHLLLPLTVSTITGTLSTATSTSALNV